jgi:hypothetical protein
MAGYTTRAKTRERINQILNATIQLEHKKDTKAIKKTKWLRWLFALMKRKNIKTEFQSCAYNYNLVVGEVRRLGNAWIFKGLLCEGCVPSASIVNALRHGLSNFKDYKHNPEPCWLLQKQWFLSIKPVKSGDIVSLQREAVLGVSSDLLEKALKTPTPGSSQFTGGSSKIKRGISSRVRAFLTNQTKTPKPGQ